MNQSEVLKADLKMIEGKLKRHFGRTFENATPVHVYEAVSMCVRDEIMDAWTTGWSDVDKTGKKMVVYLSAEFLMGRALSNNMINLGMLERYEKALNTVGFSLQEVEDVENAKK